MRMIVTEHKARWGYRGSDGCQGARRYRIFVVLGYARADFAIGGVFICPSIFLLLHTGIDSKLTTTQSCCFHHWLVQWLYYF